MKNNTILLDSFKPKQSDNILLDTNILLDLFYPLDFESTSNKYETLFNNLIKVLKCFNLPSSPRTKGRGKR